MSKEYFHLTSCKVATHSTRLHMLNTTSSIVTTMSKQFATNWVMAQQRKLTVQLAESPPAHQSATIIITQLITTDSCIAIASDTFPTMSPQLITTWRTHAHLARSHFEVDRTDTSKRHHAMLCQLGKIAARPNHFTTTSQHQTIVYTTVSDIKCAFATITTTER